MSTTNSRGCLLLVVPLLVVACADSTGPSDEHEIVEVQAGSQNTCALMRSGQLWCWGIPVGESGQNVEPLPVQYDPTLDVDHFALARFGSSLCVTSGDATSCQGAWLAYDVGSPYGTNLDERVPIQTSAALDQVSTYAGHTCGVEPDGTAICWGGALFGRRGQGVPEDLNGSIIPNVVAGGHHFLSVSAGYLHSCGVTEEQSVLCWGAADYLGAPDAEVLEGPDACFFQDFGCTWAPVPVALTNVSSLSASGMTCAVSNGEVYCWDHETVIPTLVPIPRAIEAVTTVSTRACALADDGSAWCWGLPGPGLGHAGQDGLPGRVETSLRFIQLSTGSDHSCGVTEDHELYCWGANHAGELGNGQQNTGSASPVQVLFPWVSTTN